VVIKGEATFTKGASFGTMSDGGSETSVYIEKVNVTGGQTLTGITNVNFGNAESPAVSLGIGTVGAHGSGAITIPAGGGLKFADNTLTFTGEGGTLDATVALNDATVELEPGATFNMSNGNIAFTMAQAEGGKGGFTIDGNAVLGMGAVRSDTPATVVASGSILLNIPARLDATTWPVLVVENTTLDLRDGGGIVFSGSESRIVFEKGGNLTLSLGGTPASALSPEQAKTGGVIIAGWNGGSASLITGSTGVNNAVQNTVSLGTLSAGTFWAFGEDNGETSLYPNAAGGYINVLSSSNEAVKGFVYISGTSAVGGSVTVDTNAAAIPDGEVGIAVFSKERDN
jgi:hypothetical protein